jgi:hypothetical protein
VQCARSVEGSRQQGEIRVGELLSPPEQAHSDKGIGKKTTPEPCTRWYWAEFRSVGRQTRLATGRRTIEYGTVRMMATERTRIPQGGAVRAT